MKILIVRLGRIGDMILSTPLLNQLNEGLQGSSIDVLASNDNHKILEYADYIDNVYIWDKNPLKLIPLLMKLRKKNYDVILEPKDHYSTESYYIAGLVKAEKRIGFVNGESSIFDVDISDYNKNMVHFQDKTLSTLKAFDLEPNYESRIPLNYPGYKTKDNKKENYIVVNISASRESKSVPYEIGKVLLDYLKSKNVKALLMASPNDNLKAEKLSNVTGTERVKTNSIIDTFPIIHKATGLISADTSLVHIAGSYNTPVMVLSKSIEKELLKFAPKSDTNLVVKSESEEQIKIGHSKIILEVDKFINLILKA